MYYNGHIMRAQNFDEKQIANTKMLQIVQRTQIISNLNGSNKIQKNDI